MFGKFMFFAFALLFMQNISGQNGWERLDIPTKLDLKTVHFTDSLFGWVAGDTGVILHTNDGGLSWAHQNSKTSNPITSVYFLDRYLGWATAANFSELPYGTELLRTNNSGEDWVKSVYPQENIFMNCVLFLDSLNGWMGGSPHVIVNTKDGGMTWSQAEVDTSTLAFFPVLNIKFYDENYGYASGGIFDIAGVTWHTSDGGEKWFAIEPSDAPADEVHGLHLFDSITVMGSGGDPDFGYGVGMLSTEDGGENWNYEELGIQGIAYDIDFRTDTDAWSPLGQQRKLIYSLDAGNSWTEVNSPDSTAIYDMIFPDSLHGYAVGLEGAFLKYEPPDPVSVESILAVSDYQIELFQNSPNPFRTETTISFNLIDNSGVFNKNDVNLVLIVVDANGNKVAEYKNLPLEEGIHELAFSSGDLPAGIYYYQLIASPPGKTPAIISTKKMLLLKLP